MAFKIHDQVLYPAQGVAVVEDIVEKVVSGTAIQFYKLSFMYKDMTILIPVNNSESTGVRDLSSLEVIEEALEKLHQASVEKKFFEVDVSPSGWNKRHKDYQMRVQAGDFDSVLGIYQELMFIAQQKDLSFGEKNLLHSTEELLAQELMVTRGIDRSVALQTLRAPFKHFVVTYTQGSPTQGSL